MCCLYYIQWPFNEIKSDRYYRLVLHYTRMNTNSFGTSPTDHLLIGDPVSQVTADTGSTVSYY